MATFLSNQFNNSGREIGMAYETQAVGAIIAPFIIGLIADRFFSAQKILGVLHLIGAGLMYLMATAGSFELFYPYVFLYMILYMPTLALVNSVSFRQMQDPSKEFASIRVFGTIGWILAGILIGYVLQWEARNLLQYTFYMAGAASAVLGIFSFTLPDTPPTIESNDKTSLRDILGIEAFGMLKDSRFLTFFISSILICIPLAFYYQETNRFLNEIGMQAAAGNMIFGQISEVIFMLLLPLFLKKYGIKKTLLVGMLAWVIRYILFAYGDIGGKVWMLFLGIVLHGICYDFFFVSGQIYTDFKAGEKFKSAAQGLITLATYGIGMFIGFRLAGFISDTYVLGDGHDWNSIWMIPAGIAAVVFVIFQLFFKKEKIDA
jgi:nucleoside transporter